MKNCKPACRPGPLSYNEYYIMKYHCRQNLPPCKPPPWYSTCPTPCPIEPCPCPRPEPCPCPSPEPCPCPPEPCPCPEPYEHCPCTTECNTVKKDIMA